MSRAYSIGHRVPTGRAFTFDCPACGARMKITADERDDLIQCAACRVEFPGPDFRSSRLDPAPPPRSRSYRCACTICRGSVEVSEHFVGRYASCPHCKNAFRQPPPPWEKWRRPVAKVFTGADRRRSLHHLMLRHDYSAAVDERLSERDLRRFEFYCGGCGRLRQARVWDIAYQRVCENCGVLMIVPSLRWRRALSGQALVAYRAAASGQCSSRLYCPQCGGVVSPADRSRERMTRCPTCEIWF